MNPRIKVADDLAILALVFAAIAAGAGLLVAGLYRDPAEGIRQAQATDLVRHDRRGPASATAGLAFLVLLGLSVLAIFAVDAAAGVSVEVVPIVLFGLVTAIAAVLLGLAVSSTPREGTS